MKKIKNLYPFEDWNLETHLRIWWSVYVNEYYPFQRSLASIIPNCVPKFIVLNCKEQINKIIKSKKNKKYNILNNNDL